MSDYDIKHLTNSSKEANNIKMDDEIPNCLTSILSGSQDEVLPESELEANDPFAWVVEGLLILIAFLIGLFGNSFSIVIFARQKVHRIFHHLLLLLAIFDMVS